MLDEFEFNLYINGLAIGFSQITAYVASYFIVSKAKRKVIAIICFSITCICAFVLIFVWKQGSG
jgi:UDP-N-acetylmuramyl pentapeptide phosphotransferase/UDP-N-acetylglucosamine-1-phosphate transferase